jgi:hypothetical protein
VLFLLRGDLLVGDGGDAACRYCGNLVYVHAPPPPPVADASRRVGTLASANNKLDRKAPGLSGGLSLIGSDREVELS